MKILFINASLTDGGSERAMTLVANQMAAMGHDVTMLLIRDKERTYKVSPLVEVIQLKYPSKNKLSILPRRLYAIRRLVKEKGPDCIISFMCDVNVMTLAATMGLKTRKVVSERAFPNSGERSRFGTLLEHLFYRSADTIVFQAPGAMDCFPANLRRKGVVIPNIVQEPSFEPYVGERTKRVVTAGRLTAQKNYPMLIKAFARFSEGHPDYNLEVFGDGDQRVELEALARELGVVDRVVFEGYVSNVSERINDASIFAMSSNYEGISNAMAEAMALGLPTVCTDCPVGGAAMMIEDGANGVLVPVGDDVALAKAMARIADDDAFAKSISRKARDVVNQFSAGKIGLMWEDAIRGNQQ